MTTETVRQPFVFEIREEKFEDLVARFNKMVGRARKNKLPAPSFAVIHEVDEKKVKHDINSLGERIEVETWVRYLYIAVEGDRPHLSGWDFIATIDHTDEGGNIIKSVPGAGEVPVSYRNALPVCEHCNRARHRHETFVVRQGDVTKQIGRNCLQDFFPGLSPADVAQQLAWWTEAVEMLGEGYDEGEGMGGRPGQARYGLEPILVMTQACIDAFGWTSRTKAGETGRKATADYVTLPYRRESDLSTQDKEDLKEIRKHWDAEKHAPTVQAALEWARSIDPETAEDYLYNLNVICKGETVRADRLGLACSLLPAYRRFIEGEREKQETAANPSEFVGTVGQRGLFPGCTLKFVSEPYANSFGTTTRLMFVQGANVIIWWASNSEGFTLGETYDLVATPKKHEEYANARKGTVTKQTVVNRVAVATEKDVKKYGPKKPRKVKS